MAYKASLFFWRKIKGTTYVFQPRDKFFFGMLYINLLNLVRFEVEFVDSRTFEVLSLGVFGICVSVG